MKKSGKKIGCDDFSRFDMDRPDVLRTFSVCIKSTKSVNNKTFSLYTRLMTLEQLYKIIYTMIIDQRNEYIDFEKRYSFGEDDDGYTHNLQIFSYDDNNKVIDSKSFSFKEYSYSANEIADIIEIWFKKKLREQKGWKICKGKVKKILEGVI